MLFCILSCRKEIQDELEPIISDPIIELIYPGEGEEINYCCFNFEWECDDSKSEYNLILSEDETFWKIKLDTILSQKSFELNRELKPGHNYFWKVKSGDTEVQGRFKIVDYLEKYQGSYEAIITMKTWNYFDDITWDTTFSGYITLEKVSRLSVKVIEEETNSSVIYNFAPSWLYVDENEVGFSYDFITNSAICKINYETDAIYATRNTGGLSAGTKYSFTSKTD